MSEVISLEELQEDLQAEQEEKDSIIKEIDSLFDDAGFRKVDKMNNISYQQTTRDYRAQFSIEDTSFNYSCYITTEGENSLNYTAKGTMDGIVKAAYKFVSELNDILDTPDDVEDVDDDDVSDIQLSVGDDLALNNNNN